MVDGTRVGITPIDESVFHGGESARIFAECVRFAERAPSLLVPEFPRGHFTGFITTEARRIHEQIALYPPQLTRAEYAAALYLLNESEELRRLPGEGSSPGAVEGFNTFGSNLTILAGLREMLAQGQVVPRAAGYHGLVTGLRLDSLQISTMAPLGLEDYLVDRRRSDNSLQAFMGLGRGSVSYFAGIRQAGRLYMRVHAHASSFVSPEYTRR